MFVGREEELAVLERHYGRGSFEMAVVYGRRRVGKTTLVAQFASGKRALFFTGLEQRDADNLRDFSAAASSFFGLPMSFSSWREAFSALAAQATREPFIFVFDEFPYAAKAHPALPSELQVAIDHELKNTGIFLILCGSNQGFIESDVLGEKSPLYGRRTVQLKIQPLGFAAASQLLPEMPVEQRFGYYACFGGVPYYLAQIDPRRTFRQNIRELFFRPSGFCFEEPRMLLRQELTEPMTYHSVLRAIAEGSNKPGEIAGRAGIAATSLPRYLSTLVDLGIVERVVPFGEIAASSKRGLYRIRETIFDFWFRFVWPHSQAIEAGMGALAEQRLTGSALNAYLGLRFERLCAEWLSEQALEGKLPIDALMVGAWWGANPATRTQTDIDVLAADTISRTLLIGECKYRESFDETAVLEGLEAKQNLVAGYTAKAFALFTKHPLSPGTTAKLANRPEVFAVSLSEMYPQQLV